MDPTHLVGFLKRCYKLENLIGPEIQNSTLIRYDAHRININMKTLLGVKQPSINNLQMMNKAWPHKWGICPQGFLVADPGSLRSF